MNGREELARALLDKMVINHHMGEDTPGTLLTDFMSDEDIADLVKLVVAYTQSVERNIQNVCAGFVWHAAVQAHQAPTNTIKGGWYKDGAVAALQDAAKRLKALEIEPQDTPNDTAQSGQTLLKLD